MFDINARFVRKEYKLESEKCTVDKVIRLSAAEYDSFAADMLQDQDFIRDNTDIMRHDPDGGLHSLLVVGEGKPDGILVDASGYDYARYTAFIPGIGDTLPLMRYPALAELNKKLEALADHIVGLVKPKENVTVSMEDLEVQNGSER